MDVGSNWTGFLFKMLLGILIFSIYFPSLYQVPFPIRFLIRFPILFLFLFAFLFPFLPRKFLMVATEKKIKN